MFAQGYSPAEIAEMANGKLVGNPGQLKISVLLTDSRKLASPIQTLFFAIKTSRGDGHNYIPELYNKGVRYFCVSQLPQTQPAEACFILVKNTLESLQQLAAAHREHFSCPVIGITGSNGKTIIKEWLWQLLSPEKTIVRSPKSYNSQIGVPLSVWQMNPLHNLAVFEAGISQTGEMEQLKNIIKPDIGIFTNIGQAHDQFFHSQEQKTNEKLKLFENVKHLIYCIDDQLIHKSIISSGFTADRLFSWGRNEQASLRIISTFTGKTSSKITSLYQGHESTITIPFTDEASIENACHCWATMLLMGYGPDVTASRMLRLQAVAMRLEMKEGINGCAVINDTYSSDPESLAIALDFLVQQSQYAKRTVILSDLLQGKTGHEATLYQSIARLLHDKGITRLIAIGSTMKQYQTFFTIPTEFHPDTEHFLEQFRSEQFQNESILLKGARIFGFERINEVLQQKSHETVLEVNLNALVHNLNYYRSLLNPGTKLMAMVKAFSYGSGGYEIANTLEFHRADYLAVAYADEGVELRKAGISLPVMVMNPEDSGMEAILRHSLEPEIYNFRTLHMLEKAIHSYNFSSNQPVFIHLKLDTGMHRLGFEAKDIDTLIHKIKAIPQIAIRSVFSHLVGSDDPLSDQFTRFQIETFSQMADKLKTAYPEGFLRHILNSAGISRFPEAQFEMVRLGISLYGIAANQDEQQQLETVTSLKTSISQIKTIRTGDSVGYNRAWIAQKETTIATIPIGYADGLSRRLSNGRGRMMVNGKLVSVVGNICMDMTMLDISGVQASEGDEVIVFGNEYPISHMAAAMETIPYEILTGISRRVKRVYFQE
ncbi:MAG: bifunctional UDP-N-acetylmuramoyl-tripeptide:D-alanyl-D-alanine ligase/alanine racemase [Lentimicrobiaceae bacterium]|nr:bifunctional UDP-N-acetylmuramoyl-tripeptide:D-alanyl-D-alanine ligase/alanine racemase [Lentimicrobiaceae bacterium]